MSVLVDRQGAVTTMVIDRPNARALDPILSGRPVGATEALAMGLANRLVANGEAQSGAVRFGGGEGRHGGF